MLSSFRSRIVQILSASLALACVIGMVEKAHALKVELLPLRDLVDQSGAVILGTAVAIDPTVGAKRGSCASAVTIRIDQVLGGSVPDARQLSFELPVGDLPDGTHAAVPGLPTFQVGESYLLFIARGEWGLNPITNVLQGFWRKANVNGRSYFVDHMGRGVERLSEDGFVTGARLTRPTPQRLQDFVESEEPGVETFAVSPAKAAEAAVKMLPAEQVVTELRKWIAQSTINLQTPDIRLRPSRFREFRK